MLITHDLTMNSHHQIVCILPNWAFLLINPVAIVTLVEDLKTSGSLSMNDLDISVVVKIRLFRPGFSRVIR